MNVALLIAACQAVLSVVCVLCAVVAAATISEDGGAATAKWLCIAGAVAAALMAMSVVFAVIFRSPGSTAGSSSVAGEMPEVAAATRLQRIPPRGGPSEDNSGDLGTRSIEVYPRSSEVSAKTADSLPRPSTSRFMGDSSTQPALQSTDAFVHSADAAARTTNPLIPDIADAPECVLDDVHDETLAQEDPVLSPLSMTPRSGTKANFKSSPHTPNHSPPGRHIGTRGSHRVVASASASAEVGLLPGFGRVGTMLLEDDVGSPVLTSRAGTGLAGPGSRMMSGLGSFAATDVSQWSLSTDAYRSIIVCARLNVTSVHSVSADVVTSFHFRMHQVGRELNAKARAFDMQCVVTRREVDCVVLAVRRREGSAPAASGAVRLDFKRISEIVEIALSITDDPLDCGDHLVRVVALNVGFLSCVSSGATKIYAGQCIDDAIRLASVAPLIRAACVSSEAFVAEFNLRRAFRAVTAAPFDAVIAAPVDFIHPDLRLGSTVFDTFIESLTPPRPSRPSAPGWTATRSSSTSCARGR